MTLPFSPWGHLEGGVADVAGLLTEDGPQEALLGGELGLALGSDLAHQDVLGGHLGADADDAALVEVLEGVLAHVGDVAGDLLGSQLGVTSLALVVLDVDGGEDVVRHQFLGEQDGVLEVVAFPGHEGHQHVAAESELAALAGGAVGEDVAGLDLLALADQRALVDARARVGALELAQLDGAGAATRRGVRVLVADLDAVGRGGQHAAVLLRHHEGAGVLGCARLHARAHDGRDGTEQGHGLALHVRAHQGSVGVIVLEEGNEGGGDGHDLLGRHVHEVDLVAVDNLGLVAGAHDDALVEDVALLVHVGVGLGNDVIVFLVGARGTRSPW